MNKYVMKLCFIVSIALTSTTFAATGSSSGLIEVIRWYEGHTGVLIIQDQKNMSDLGGCGRSDYYILDETQPFFKEIYSLVLSAHIAKQPLTFTIDGCVEGISRIKHVRSIINN